MPSAHDRARVTRRERAPRGRVARRAPWVAPSAWFALAAAWRLAYLARLGHTAFADSLDADSRIYWDWSSAILSQGVVPPAPFFLAPLYPYALALWRALGAHTLGQALV